MCKDSPHSQRFHSFACAHLLGALELLEAARHAAAAHEGRGLLAAVAQLELPEDAATWLGMA